MSPWGFIRRRNQPLASGLLRTHYNGRVIGSSIVAANPHATDDGFGLTLGGGIPRGTREYTFWQGDGTDNIAYARTTKPYVITTGSENQPCTFVVVFKMQTTGISNTSIAGLGAQTGTSGSTLFRLMGGTAAANLYLQVQDGGGTIPYNAQLTTPVAVNDLRWHTAVVTFDMVSGGNARCYVDGVAPSANLNYTGGNFTSNTTFDYVSACGIIRGGSPLAYGPFDVALFVPMFGAKLSDAEGISLSANPWQLFEPVIDTVVVNEVTGGAISGANVITLTNTATLTGNGSLAGSNAITLTNTGTLTGEGALAGANAITLTNSGTLDAPTGAMTGTNAITITNAGTLLGNGALAGTDAITLSNTGTLAGQGALAGTNAMTFTNIGTLELPGAMAGTNAMTIGNDGTLLGAAQLSGINLMSFVNTGTLDQPQVLSQGGHFGFNEKRRKKRFDDERQDEEKRKKILREALFGLPPEKRETVTTNPEATITRAAETVVDYSKLLKKIQAIQDKIDEINRLEEEEIAEVTELIRAGLI